MAKVYIIFKVMPTGTEVNLDELEKSIEQKVNSIGATYGKTEREPIGFGLHALKVFVTMDEDKADTDKVEEDLKSVEGVMSAESIDIRKALG